MTLKTFLPILILILNSTIVANTYAASYIGPVMTDAVVTWTSPTQYTYSVTLTALPLTDEQYNQIAPMASYCRVAHVHYAEPSNTRNCSIFSNAYTHFANYGTEQKLNFINNLVFNTYTPTIGMTNSVTSTHSGTIPEGFRECIGPSLAYSEGTTQPMSNTIDWPTPCITTPPSLATCTLDISTTVYDFGTISKAGAPAVDVTTRVPLHGTCTHGAQLYLSQPMVANSTVGASLVGVTATNVDSGLSYNLPTPIETRPDGSILLNLDVMTRYTEYGTHRMDLILMYTPY